MKKGIITTRIVLHAFFFILLFSNCTSTDNSKNNNAHKIIVEANISKYFYRELKGIFEIKDEVALFYRPFPLGKAESSSESVSGKVIDSKVKWIMHSDQPIRISPPFGNPVIMYPGDSLNIEYNRDYPVYSGTNMTALTLLDSLMILNNHFVRPRKKHSYNVGNLEDFLEWNQYLDNKLVMQLPPIEFYKDSISPEEYEYYKANLIGSIEADRLHAFSGLYRTVYQGRSNLNRSDLVRIWDSTQNKPSRQWLHALSAYDDSIFDIYTFMWMEIYKQAGFDTANVYYKSKEVFTSTLYNKAKQNYKGKLREQLMAHILDEPTITEMGLKNPTTQALLKDYYSQPGYPEYKAWVKGLEKKKQQRELENEKKKKDKNKQAG